MLKQYPFNFCFSEKNGIFKSRKVEESHGFDKISTQDLKLLKSIFGIRVSDSSSQPGSGGTESAVGWERCF